MDMREAGRPPETDSSGGTRQQVDESQESTASGSSGSGEPVVEKELAPRFPVSGSAQEEEMRRQKEISAMQALFDCRHIK